MRLLSIIFIISTFFSTSYGQSVKKDAEIFALRYAVTKSKDPISYVALNAPDSVLFEPVFMFWLIKTTSDKMILIDAGFINDDESFESRYNLKTYQRPDSLLQKIGISASDITDIIITHPHRDHIDGIDLFPNAQIWMQKEDFNYFVGDSWKLDPAEHGYMERDVLKIIKANFAQRLNLIDGEKEIFPGISVYTGSRHTFNSQYVVVETTIQNIVLASDNAYSYYNIENSVSAPSYATRDTIGYAKQLDRMKGFVQDNKYIIPGHDGLVFERFEKITDDIVRIE
ncbi:MAG: N-acyl homoserine lactonase family protein [Flavobacteriaceae bacterium]|nr:N-acyl homoserine lactonase family protein [Flavobacteriaceae bacterium]